MLPGIVNSIWNPNEVYHWYIPRIYHVYPERLYMCGIYHIYTMDIKISLSSIYVQFNAIYEDKDNLMLKPEMLKEA
jgi:hypothetical protein